MAFSQTKSAALAVAIMGIATPAFAQDAMCGGTGTGGQWIGGNEAESDIASATGYQEQMALVLGGNEYVSLFTLSEGTDVRVEAAGRGAGDPIIDLLDSDGGVILSDDDSGGNSASRAETFLNPGTYCMSLRSYDGGPMTAFVRIGLVSHEPLTEGIDTTSEAPSSAGCASAVPIGGLGSVVTASVEATPFWSFTLDAPTPVSLTAENEDADPVLNLYDSNDNLIAENDDFDGYNSRIDVTEPLAAGTYCIELEALSDSSLPITVSLDKYDPVAALQALYDQGEVSPPLDGSIEVTDLGVLETRTRQDVQASTAAVWYSIDITESSLVIAEAIGAGDSDPWLIVYDDLGRELGRNDDYEDSRDSQVVSKMEPGTYIIGVKQYSGNQGLIRLVMERYVRAN